MIMMMMRNLKCMRFNVVSINYEGDHDHFHYTGKYRGPMHSTLRYQMQNKFLWPFSMDFCS